LGLKFLQNFRAESGAEVQKSEFGFSSKKVRISFKSPNSQTFLSRDPEASNISKKVPPTLPWTRGKKPSKNSAGSAVF